MTLDDILASLFPDGHDVQNDGGVLFGSGTLRSGGRALVIGVADRTAVGVDEAIRLSRYVLSVHRTRERPDPRPRRQRQPAHEQARRASGAERVSGPSRQVPHPRGHAWPADHRPSLRPHGCRGFPRDGAGDPRAGGTARRGSGGDGSAVHGQGDEAVDRGSRRRRPSRRRCSLPACRILPRRARCTSPGTSSPAGRSAGGAPCEYAGRARPAGRARQGAWRPVEGRTISRSASVTSRSRPSDRPMRRHDLIFVSPSGWRSLLETRIDLAADPLVAHLGRQGMAAGRTARHAGRSARSAIGPAVAALRRQAAACAAHAAGRYRLDVSAARP